MSKGEDMRVFLIEERRTYLHSYTMPLGFVMTANALSRFLKARGYYVKKRAQSARAIINEIEKDGYCYFHYCTSGGCGGFRRYAGIFRPLSDFSKKVIITQEEMQESWDKKVPASSLAATE
jgi:hypothetical protein